MSTHAELENLWLFVLVLAKLSIATGFLPGVLILAIAWRFSRIRKVPQLVVMPPTRRYVEIQKGAA